MTYSSEEPDWRAGNRKPLSAQQPYSYDEVDDGDKPKARSPQNRFWRTAALMIGLAVLGSASAFGWRALYGSGIAALGSLDRETKSPANEFDNRLSELRTLQQQFINQSQSQTLLLTAQQAELKRLADQVAALSTKIDSLKASPEPAHPPAPATPAQKKHTPKPAPATSVGGAPLAPPVQLTH